MLNDTHKVTCPCCQTVLVIDRRSGEVIEERRPILDQSSGDRYADALKKVKTRGKEADEKFKQFTSEKDARKARLDALFEENLKKMKDEGVDPKGLNPYDRD